jgi:hypothetical protein
VRVPEENTNEEDRPRFRPSGISRRQPVMTWFVWLGLTVFVTAIVAVARIQPKGTRPIARTRMMGMARFALLALVIIFAYFAFQARAGG